VQKQNAIKGPAGSWWATRPLWNPGLSWAALMRSWQNTSGPKTGAWPAQLSFQALFFPRFFHLQALPGPLKINGLSYVHRCPPSSPGCLESLLILTGNTDINRWQYNLIYSNRPWEDELNPSWASPGSCRDKVPVPISAHFQSPWEQDLIAIDTFPGGRKNSFLTRLIYMMRREAAENHVLLSHS
jgi:hypothetical protein